MKKILTVGLILLLLSMAIIIFIYYPRLNLITGFASKNVCSCVFEAERDPETVAAQDNNFNPVKLSDYKVDLKEGSATANVFGLSFLNEVAYLTRTSSFPSDQEIVQQQCIHSA